MKRAITFVTAFAIFAADRVTKWLVETRMHDGQSIPIIPGLFNLARTGNPGIAFGILEDNPTRPRTLLLAATSAIVIVALALMLWRAERQGRFTASGLALILGGALGNVYDRIRFGQVTDFLDFEAAGHHWYTFNLADSAICVGAGLMLLSMFTAEGRKRKAS